MVDEEDEESDALFTMDDIVDGAADAKKENKEEVSGWLASMFVKITTKKLST